MLIGFFPAIVALAVELIALTLAISGVLTTSSLRGIVVLLTAQVAALDATAQPT